MKRIEKAYWQIMRSEVFRIDGKEIDLPEALIRLANAVRDHDGETDWSLGEFEEASLDSLLVGAYWSLTEWHGGQYSDSYAALCAIGEVFSPGMTCAPEPEAPEYAAYELVGQWFEEKHGVNA